jgi:4-aminobutyrate aminotransferase-like enzyme
MKQSKQKQKAGEGDINLSPRRAAWRQRKSGTPAEHCLEHGLSFKVSQSTCLTLTPPLTIAEEQLEKALQILAEAITALHNHSLEKGTHRA